MNNLKPCPFCGTIPEGDLRDVVYPVGRLEDVYQCVCSNPDCGATVLGWDEDSAVDHWDTRDYQDRIENLEMSDETQSEYIIELQNELKDAYKHTSVLEKHMDDLLIKVYEMEIKELK